VLRQLPDESAIGFASPKRGYDAQQSLDVGVRYREPTVVEEGAQGRLLPGPVVDGLAERVSFAKTRLLCESIAVSAAPDHP
jgi:hypothetical protein